MMESRPMHPSKNYRWCTCNRCRKESHSGKWVHRHTFRKHQVDQQDKGPMMETSLDDDMNYNQDDTEDSDSNGESHSDGPNQMEIDDASVGRPASPRNDQPRSYITDTPQPSSADEYSSSTSSSSTEEEEEELASSEVDPNLLTTHHLEDFLSSDHHYREMLKELTEKDVTFSMIPDSEKYHYTPLSEDELFSVELFMACNGRASDELFHRSTKGKDILSKM
ncbi:hypothetical protein BT69DRAFT_1296795 [Atractiella rhizophila]|nr:hypothetical protein BT69DRAFT_1296795 [Atractiella rhizophila]